MQLAKGSLEDRRPGLPEESKDLLRQVASGLAYLHGEGISHRDLKPGNILLTQMSPCQWVLADFGLSKLGEDMKTIRIGTKQFMAPEQHTRGGYTNKVDIWALGMVGIYCNPGLPRSIIEADPDCTLWCRAIARQLKSCPLKTDLEDMLSREPVNRPTAEQLQARFTIATVHTSEGEVYGSGDTIRLSNLPSQLDNHSTIREHGRKISVGRSPRQATTPVDDGAKTSLAHVAPQSIRGSVPLEGSTRSPKGPSKRRRMLQKP
jgi:serine/threonine protein kinase